MRRMKKSIVSPSFSERGARPFVPPAPPSAPSQSSDFLREMDAHVIAELRAENEMLRTLAYVSEDSPLDTWRDRAMALESVVSSLRGERPFSLDIEWMTDEHDCETCGSSWAEGAVVRLGDGVIVELRPHAACYDGASHDSAEVYRAILTSLGFSVSER